MNDYDSTDNDLLHERSWYPCTKCGASRINTTFWFDGVFFFIHTCVCCDAPSEEPVD
jgi:hypothetical protein